MMPSDMRPGRLLALQGQAIRRFPVTYLACYLIFWLLHAWVEPSRSLIDELARDTVFEIGLGSLLSAGIAAMAFRLFLETLVFDQNSKVPAFFLQKNGRLSPVLLHLPALLFLGLCLVMFSMTGSQVEREIQTLFLVPMAALLFVAAVLRPGSRSQALAAGIAPEDIPLFHWHCARHDGMALVFAGLVSFVTMLGLLAALAALDTLSLLGYGNPLYADITFFCAIILFPSLAMAGFLKLDAASPQQKSCSIIGHPDFFKIALWFRLGFSYLILPLALFYMAILYAYLVRMIVLQEWPENGVGLSIGVYLAFGFAVQMICFGLRETGPVWVRLYERFFPYAVLPLVITLLIASMERMAAYGVTELRYVLVLFVVWLGVASGFLIFRRPKLYVFPLSLALLLAVANIGSWSPWGAQGLSLSSQKQELRDLLDVISGQAHPDSTASLIERADEDQRERLRSLYRFFDARNALDHIQPIFAGYKIQSFTTELLMAFNDPSSLSVVSTPLFLHSVTEYDWQAHFHLSSLMHSKPHVQHDLQKQLGEISVKLEPKSRVLHIDGKTADQNILFDFTDLIKNPEDGYRERPAETMLFQKQAGGLHVRLWVESVHFRQVLQDNAWALENLKAHILFRFEEETRPAELENAL